RCRAAPHSGRSTTRESRRALVRPADRSRAGRRLPIRATDARADRCGWRRTAASAAARWRLAPPRRWCRTSRPSRVARPGRRSVFCVELLVGLAALRDDRAGIGRTGLEHPELRIEQELRAELARVGQRLVVLVLEALDVEHHGLQQKLARDAILLLRRHALDPLGARDLPNQLRLKRAIVAVVGAARLDADARQIWDVLDPVALLAQGRVD